MIHTRLHHKKDCRRSDAKQLPDSKGVVVFKCPDCGAIASTPRSVS